MGAFEDYAVGMTERFGRYEVTREEVIDFARRYDPSPHHLDDAAAAANPLFGRISAAGTHSVAMLTRMLVDHWTATGQQGHGSPGMTVRFLKPVFPGDTLACTYRVTEVRPSRSRPEFGIVSFTVTMANQEGVPVLEVLGTSFHRRRGD